MNNSNQRTIFNDVILIFGALVSNSFKYLKLCVISAQAQSLSVAYGIFTSACFDLLLLSGPQTRKIGFAMIRNHFFPSLSSQPFFFTHTLTLNPKP